MEFLRSNFIINSSKLFFGILMGQIISFASLPFITNIYSPEEFGLYTTILSISSIVSLFYTLQYNQAIPIPSSSKEQSDLTLMSIGLSILVFFLILTIFYFFGKNLFKIVGFSNLEKWKIHIVILSFLFSLSQTLNLWILKQKKFILISTTKITDSLTFNIGSISPSIFEFIKKEALTIIYSKLLSTLLTIFIFLNNVKSFHKFPSINSLKKYFKEYNSFPKYGFPHSLFSISVKEIPVLIISSFFDFRLVGLYFISLKFSQIPFSLVSNSLYDVFFVEFSESENKSKIFMKIFYNFLKISIPLLIVLIFCIEYIVKYTLDETYFEALKFIYVLIPLHYFKLISSIFCQTIFVYFKQQKYNFRIGVIIFLLVIISFTIGYLNQSFILGLNLSVISNISLILIKIKKSYNLTRNDSIRTI